MSNNSSKSNGMLITNNYYAGNNPGNIYATPRVTYDYRSSSIIGHHRTGMIGLMHGMPDPVVMAYPSADGFFIAVTEEPNYNHYGYYDKSRPGSCCSHEVMNPRRVKPSYFRHYPTAVSTTDLSTTNGGSGASTTGVTSNTEIITEIGSGSVCQDVCFRSFRVLLLAWTLIAFLVLLITFGLGVYHWWSISNSSPNSDQDIIINTETLVKSSNVFYSVLLEFGPVVSFFVSLVLLLIPALGFFGSYKENTWLLILFAILMIVNSCMKGFSPPKNPFLGFSSTLFLMLIPFVITLFMNRRMSRAI